MCRNIKTLFNFDPPATDEEITAQIAYALENGWAIMVEYTDDPHPRNILWEMWGMPMFDIKDPSAIMLELNACRKELPRHYIRISGYDRSLGRASTMLSSRLREGPTLTYPLHAPGRPAPES